MTTPIQITINGTVLKAELNESAAAKDLLSKLPLTKKLNDVDGYTEKVAQLDHQIATTGMANPEELHAGELAYWEDGKGQDQTFVLYAGKTDTWPNTFVIGKIVDGDYQSVIVPKNDDLQVTIELAK